MLTEAHKKTGVYHRQTPGLRVQTWLENDLQGKVHIPWAALRDHWIAHGHVGRLGDRSERTGTDGVIRYDGRKISPVQDIEHFPAELHGETFSNLCVL